MNKRKSLKRKSLKRKSVKRKSVKRKKSFSTTAGIILGSLSGLAFIGIASKLLYDNYNIDKKEIINIYLEKLSKMDPHDIESFINANPNNSKTTIDEDISTIINDKNGNVFKPEIVFINLKKYYKTSGEINKKDIEFINKTYNFIIKNLNFEFIDNYLITLKK